jgi:hypothetical protein
VLGGLGGWGVGGLEGWGGPGIYFWYFCCDGLPAFNAHNTHIMT